MTLMSKLDFLYGWITEYFVYYIQNMANIQLRVLHISNGRSMPWPVEKSKLLINQTGQYMKLIATTDICEFLSSVSHKGCNTHTTVALYRV